MALRERDRLVVRLRVRVALAVRVRVALPDRLRVRLRLPVALAEGGVYAHASPDVMGWPFAPPSWTK